MTPQQVLIGTCNESKPGSRPKDVGIAEIISDFITPSFLLLFSEFFDSECELIAKLKIYNFISMSYHGRLAVKNATNFVFRVVVVVVTVTKTNFHHTIKDVKLLNENVMNLS